MPMAEHHPRQSQLDRNIGALLTRGFSRVKQHKTPSWSSPPPPPLLDPTLELVCARACCCVQTQRYGHSIQRSTTCLMDGGVDALCVYATPPVYV